MPVKKGFTLIEIIIAMIITAILAAIAIPAYFDYIQQVSAAAAQNNLISIYSAQRNSYLGPTGGNYCLDTSPSPCDSMANINTNLSLNILDSNFNYTCVTDASGFSCTATNLSDNTFILTLTNNPIVLPAGNPSCIYPTKPSYCPV